MLSEGIDWLVPAKSLNRSAFGDLTPDRVDDFFDADDSFYGSAPLAYSTPLPKNMGMYASNNDNGQDIVMEDPANCPQGRVLHGENSIYTDSNKDIADPSLLFRYLKQSVLDEDIPFPCTSSPAGPQSSERPHLIPVIARPSESLPTDSFVAFGPAIVTPPASPSRSPPHVLESVEGSLAPDALENLFSDLELHGM